MKAMKTHLVISAVCLALAGGAFAQGAGGGNGGGNGGGGTGGGSAGQGGTGMGTPSARGVTGSAASDRGKNTMKPKSSHSGRKASQGKGAQDTAASAAQ